MKIAEIVTNFVKDLKKERLMYLRFSLVSFLHCLHMFVHVRMHIHMMISHPLHDSGCLCACCTPPPDHRQIHFSYILFCTAGLPTDPPRSWFFILANSSAILLDQCLITAKPNPNGPFRAAETEGEGHLDTMLWTKHQLVVWTASKGYPPWSNIML